MTAVIIVNTCFCPSNCVDVYVVILKWCVIWVLEVNIILYQLFAHERCRIISIYAKKVCHLIYIIVSFVY